MSASTPQTDDEASRRDSALADNIDRKGRNAYYYAHAHKADGPVWDMKPEPRLLKTEKVEGEKEAVVVARPITDYAWEDQDKKVKIYVMFEGVGELSDDAVKLDFAENSFSLTVMGYKGENHKLTFATLFANIENATAKKKPNKFILTLFKTEENSWPCIAQGTPS